MAAITSAFDSAYKPMPKKSAAVQKTRIAIRIHDTGALATCSEISRRDCSTMLAYWLAVARAAFCASVAGLSVARKSVIPCALASGTATVSNAGSTVPLPQIAS
jgi:hypothetical protein